VIEKAVLLAVTNPGADAERVLVPERSMLRPLNVALPESFVDWVVDPLRVPVPERIARVTGRPEAGALFPSESRT